MPHPHPVLFAGWAIANLFGALAAATLYDVLFALAPAINTILLIYLSWWSHRHKKDAEEVKAMVSDNTARTTHAAKAAASAAEAAAVAARIGKELGGTMRSSDPANITHPDAPKELPPQ